MVDSTLPVTRSRLQKIIRSFTLRVVLISILVILLLSGFGVSLGSIGQGLALSLIGVSVYLTFRLLDFPDLTVDGSFPIGGAVAAILIVSGIPAEWSILIGFAAGAITGLYTALINLIFKIEGLLASIIVMTGAYTITLRIMGSSNIPLLDQRTILTPYLSPVRDFLAATFNGNTRRLTTNVVEILVFAVVVIIALLMMNWFLHTEVGLTMRAAGKNRQMVRALGVDDRHMVILALMLANGMAGVAGALTVQQQGFADVQMGVGVIVRGLAAVMIGEALLRPRTTGQSLLAVTLGMIIFEVLRAWVFTAFNLAATDIRLVSALVVLCALVIPKLGWRGRFGKAQ